MLTKKDIFTTIQLHKDDIKQFGIKEIGLFGSYVRDEQTEKSDIDLLVEFYREKKNFKNFMGFCFYMDDLFNSKKIEVVTKKSLSEYIGPYILKEVEYVEI